MAALMFDIGLFAAFAGISCSSSPEVKEDYVKPMLIDDFSSNVSALNTEWEGFTDRVMGGVSDMQVRIRRDADHPYLSMSGKVSLKNNGGFIQARLLLGQGSRPSFDVRSFTGIRIMARGQGDDYYLFLRTTQNVFPWSFYMAKLPVTDDWQEVLIPFTSFTKGDFGAFFELDLSKLSSLAVVAYKKEFVASLDVREIGFY